MMSGIYSNAKVVSTQKILDVGSNNYYLKIKGGSLLDLNQRMSNGGRFNNLGIYDEAKARLDLFSKEGRFVDFLKKEGVYCLNDMIVYPENTAEFAIVLGAEHPLSDNFEIRNQYLVMKDKRKKELNGKYVVWISKAHKDLNVLLSFKQYMKSKLSGILLRNSNLNDNKKWFSGNSDFKREYGEMIWRLSGKKLEEPLMFLAIGDMGAYGGIRPLCLGLTYINGNNTYYGSETESVLVGLKSIQVPPLSHEAMF